MRPGNDQQRRKSPPSKTGAGFVPSPNHRDGANYALSSVKEVCKCPRWRWRKKYPCRGVWGCFLQYKHRESSVGRQGRRDRGLGQAQGGAASWRTHPAPSLRSRFRRSSSFLVLRLKLAARFVYGGDQHPSGRRINTRANSRETAPATDVQRADCHNPSTSKRAMREAYALQ